MPSIIPKYAKKAVLWVQMGDFLPHNESEVSKAVYV